MKSKARGKYDLYIREKKKNRQQKLPVGGKLPVRMKYISDLTKTKVATHM